MRFQIGLGFAGNDKTETPLPFLKDAANLGPNRVGNIGSQFFREGLHLRSSATVVHDHQRLLRMCAYAPAADAFRAASPARTCASF